MAAMIGNLVTSEGRTWVSTIMTRRVEKSVIRLLLRLGLTVTYCHS